MSDVKYRKKARENIPQGFYVLSVGECLRPDDLLWCWTSEEWLRADDARWKPKETEVIEDMICAVRSFESQFPNRRRFVLK